MRASLTKASILQQAGHLFPKYREAIATIPPEAGFGGIWESEMFLFYVAVHLLAPKQILESGRARGKSTMILAQCFPSLPIVSVEFDQHSDTAAAAEQKLNRFGNVELLYGDSRQILPQRLQPGDAVLIDGPKEFRALHLALALLRTKRPSTVFVHDFPPRSPWRRFVERHWPDAFFGDDPAFDSFRELDQQRDPRGERRGYGIFAVFPSQLPASPAGLRFGLLLTRLLRQVV